MQTPQFSDFLFTSAALLNGASGSIAAGVQDITGTLFTPGLVNSANISFTESLLNINVTFASTARVLFGSGVLSGGYGVTDGTINGLYVVNMTALVPLSGSVTAYIVATRQQIGQQAALITGPSPGHPDYDPLFVPYMTYLENLDSIAVTGTLTPADNVSTIELCRVVLVSGETNISSVITEYQIEANVFNNSQKPYYNKTQSLSFTTSNYTTYDLTTQLVEFPTLNRTGGFRLLITGVISGLSTGTLTQNFLLSISDGSTTQNGANWLVGATNNNQAVGVESTFLFPTVYSPGSNATLVFSLTTLGGGGIAGQLAMQSATLIIQVVDA